MIKVVKRGLQQGFTLIEIILVLVIISVLSVYAILALQQQAQNIRIDRTTMEMQQILNAALSYYINNGMWPPSGGSDCASTAGSNVSNAIGFLTAAQLLPQKGSGTLPTNTTTPNGAYQLQSPFPGAFYCAGPSQAVSASNIPAGQVFFVTLNVGATSAVNQAIAVTIMGRLPNGYVFDPTQTPNTATPASIASATNTSTAIYAGVNVPAQSLNMAGTLSFAGLYHNGACIPAPVCPIGSQTMGNTNGQNLSPEVYVVPASVNGLQGFTTSSPPSAYPISGFTAYAVSGNANGSPSTSPPSCKSGGTATACAPGVNADGTSSSGVTGQLYWRACLAVTTSNGNVSGTSSGTTSQTDPGAEVGFVMAITRCQPTKEYQGSSFSVWGQYPY